MVTDFSEARHVTATRLTGCWLPKSLNLLTVDERLTAYGKNIMWIKAG